MIDNQVKKKCNQQLKNYLWINENEPSANLSISNTTTSNPIKIEQVPLISFNKGANLMSLRLDEEQEKMLLELAAKVTGSIETAKPMNAKRTINESS